MPNSATQNPANKVGRNSGGGAGGVSEIVPTQAEADRGVQPLQTGRGPEVGNSGGGTARLGVVALLGAGIAALVTRKLRQPKSRLDRVRDYVGRKSPGDRVRNLVGRRKSRTDRLRDLVGWK